MKFQIIEKYLIDRGHGEDLIKYRTTKELTSSMRNNIMKSVLQITVNNYGPNPSKGEKTLVCKATLLLFPDMEYKNSQQEGVVSIIKR